MKLPKFRISHIYFCLIYSAVLYFGYNAINLDKFTRWFYIKDQFDYLGITAFFLIGFCGFLAVFTLFAHRKTIKPLAIILIIFATCAVYFTSKYDVAIDRNMIMLVFHTDPAEVHSLLSIHMIPYAIFLIILPICLVLLTQITFENSFRYFISSLKLILITLVIGIGLVYFKFDSIHRAANLSKKYILHSLAPVNVIQSFGSLGFNAIKHNFHHKKNVEISGTIEKQDNLIVILAVGETSRQQNFSLYGYKRQDTNPTLEKDKNLHLLNGKARVGSTLYALPEILVKDDVPLPAITSKLGINTSCYVNYTLYENCAAVGEQTVKNCGHNGNCYDEDVIPMLDENLKSYKSGYRFIVLHLGGGSHGPSYYERIPPEFQRFKPMCFDADVVNHCSLEQLYNAYDNTILYVDYVLGKIINKLDQSKLPYVFIYLSDHGESLMEDGRVFHGMPPGITLPYEQAHIPLIVKSSIPISIAKREEYSQQNVYETVLDLFSIKSNVSDPEGSFIKKQNDKSSKK